MVKGSKNLLVVDDHHDLPPYTTVYNYFQKWQQQGIWQHLQTNQELSSRETSQQDNSSSLIEGLSSMSPDWTIALHRAAQLCNEEDIE